MGLAGINELDGALAVVRQFDDAVKVVKNQRGALVGGEAAGKTDGEGVGIEQLIEGDEIRLRQALALDEEAAAGELDQFAAQLEAQGPKLLVGNESRVGDFFPEFRRIDFL